jgi:hypothetical protein
VTRYVVVLEVRRRGSSCGTTEDTFEAADAAEAEAQAVAAWTSARPDCTFAPLLTTTERRYAPLRHKGRPYNHCQPSDAEHLGDAAVYNDGFIGWLVAPVPVAAGVGIAATASS